MRIHRKFLALFLVPAFLSGPATSAADKEEAKIPEGFKSLFNGNDLKGWKVYNGKKEVWGVADGAIYCEKDGGGWLMSEDEFADFEFRLEFKLSKGANSGVALRAPLEGDPAYQGMEIQLIDDENWKSSKLLPTQHTGSIYGIVPPTKQVNKPFGEWNKMRIVCKGPKVSITVNGETIVDANLDDHKEKHAKGHPGILREKGHVGFQSYNTRVEFKKCLDQTIVDSDQWSVVSKYDSSEPPRVS